MKRSSETDEALEAEILPPDHPDPEARDVTPGWIGRHRVLIERGRQVSRAFIPLAPPPARLALAGVSVAADVLLLADDLRRRGDMAEEGPLRAGALVLEGAALAAMSRYAPARLARNLAGIEAARAALSRLRNSAS
ncbi:MAG: hypothetical protein AAFR17_13075 [Pseudomonadota bacterium]